MTGLTSLIINKPINCSKVSSEIKGWVKEQVYSGNPASPPNRGTYMGKSIYLSDCTIVLHFYAQDNKCFSNVCKFSYSFPKKILGAVAVDVYHGGGPTNTKIYFLKHEGEPNFNKDVTFELDFLHGSGSDHAFIVVPFKRVDVWMTGATKPFRHVTLTITILDILEGDSDGQ